MLTMSLEVYTCDWRRKSCSTVHNLAVGPALFGVYKGIILGLYRDNGNDNGNYH